MGNFRITYTDGPMGDLRSHRDVFAKSMDEALSMATNSFPEAKSGRFTDFTVEEIEEGPKVIGICYNYYDHSCKSSFKGYTFIWANDEKQAVEFYNRNIKGHVFYQPWPDKFDDNGNCEYGAVEYTYFAGCNGYKYNAIQEETA